MSRDQYRLLCQLFEGTTVRELRHLRDVPRASMRLGQPPVVHRRPSRPDRWTARLPVHELDDASSDLART